MLEQLCPYLAFSSQLLPPSAAVRQQMGLSPWLTQILILQLWLTSQYYMQDLMTNPLIVPVKVLRDFQPQQSRQGGACDCKFHPTQPWMFVGGADGVVYLFGDQ